MATAKKPTEITAEFDFDKLTALEFDELRVAEKEGDMRRLAELYSRVITKTSLGKADDPMTYLKRPVSAMFVLSTMLGKALGDEVKAERNFQEPSTTG